MDIPASLPAQGYKGRRASCPAGCFVSSAASRTVGMVVVQVRVAVAPWRPLSPRHGRRAACRTA